MDQLTITAVVPGPRLQLDCLDPSSGGILPTTIYSGHVAVERNKEFRGIVRATDLVPCAFFLPDSAPYPQAPPVVAVETSLRAIRTMGNPNLVFFGAHDAQAAVVADPRGTGQHWLQVSFRTPIASFEEAQINYRVTVQAEPRPTHP